MVLIHSCLAPSPYACRRSEHPDGAQMVKKSDSLHRGQETERSGQGSHGSYKGCFPVTSLPPTKPRPLKVALTLSSTTGWGSSLLAPSPWETFQIQTVASGKERREAGVDWIEQNGGVNGDGIHEASRGPWVSWGLKGRRRSQGAHKVGAISSKL